MLAALALAVVWLVVNPASYEEIFTSEDDIILNKALDLISQGEYLKKDYFAMENHESSLKENYLLYGAATAGLAGVACLAVMRRGRRR